MGPITLLSHNGCVRWLRCWIVDGLEVGCRATRFLERAPGWSRVYRCNLAKWSNQLDERWGTGRWAVHGWGLAAWDAWEPWYEGLTAQQRDTGHWHVFD